MNNIRYFDNKINIKNKNIILRTDFNVPIENQIIKDLTRIELCLPFITDLLQKNAKVFLITHLGRPANSNEKNLSLKPIFNYFKKIFPNKVFFYEEEIKNETKNKLSFLKQGELLIFENIRFNEGEIKNEDKFSKNLSSVGDLYINDAFSCSHRKQASIHKITKYIKNSFAGPMLMKEMKAIDMIIKSKKKPVTCIIGGAKISTKIGVILSLMERIDNLIIVGAMANNFIKYQGSNVGKSLIEKDTEQIVKKIFDKAESSNCQITTPIDCAVSTSLNGNPFFKNYSSVDENDIILDIGPKTIKKIHDIIDLSKTILWNGPAGYFENKNFSLGTISIAKKISNNTEKNSLISIVGGGDTLAAIKNNDLKLKFTHLSTAGGAFLEYIEGKNLPGIEVLK